ncbi:hypothetical protein ACLB2K_074379 [Fragaria x ananassa]
MKCASHVIGKKQYNSYISKSSKPPLRSFQGKYYGGQSSKVEVPAMDFPTQPTYNKRRTLYATFNHLKPEVSRHEICGFFWSAYGDVIESVVMAEETPPLHAWITFYTPEIADQIMAEGPPPLKLWMKGGKSMWLKPFFP